jgi:tRNA threonylcarbamoyladenosine modification (KEOPS) complex  Pcc1 subunit
MPSSASICLSFDSKEQLDVLMVALMPETEAPPTHRSTVELKKEGICLTLMIVADDTVALRATINAYMHWIQSALNVIDIVKKA